MAITKTRVNSGLLLWRKLMLNFMEATRSFMVAALMRPWSISLEASLKILISNLQIHKKISKEDNSGKTSKNTANKDSLSDVKTLLLTTMEILKMVWEILVFCTIMPMVFSKFVKLMDYNLSEFATLGDQEIGLESSVTKTKLGTIIRALRISLIINSRVMEIGG